MADWVSCGLVGKNKNKQMSQGLGWAERLKALGPGILLATAAIGGSHIVASTQAGALYGWQLAGLILLVNLCKYPFFRFGVEYNLNTGQNLLVGYQQQSRWYLLSFVWLNLVAGIVNTAGVLILTAALLQFFVPVALPLSILCLLLLLVCLTILLAGHYKLLDQVSKAVMVLLTITTLAAAFIAVQRGMQVPADFQPPSPWQLASLGFLVALMGWMPAPIELSAVNSLWLEAKQQQTPISRKAGLFDFHLGYWSTTVLALVFLTLGAMVQYGSPQSISMAGGAYIQQFVQMYAATIGEWSTGLVALVAFLCMFGTTLTVLDGYARTINASFHLLGWQRESSTSSYNRWLLLQAAAGLLVILFFKGALAPMLSFAMTLAFLSTPIFAWLNYRLMARQRAVSGALKWLSWLGLVYLTGFAGLFLWYLLLG